MERKQEIVLLPRAQNSIRTRTLGQCHNAHEFLQEWHLLPRGSWGCARRIRTYSNELSSWRHNVLLFLCSWGRLTLRLLPRTTALVDLRRLPSFELRGRRRLGLR